MINISAVPQQLPSVYPRAQFSEGCIIAFDFQDTGSKLIEQSALTNNGSISGAVLQSGINGYVRYFDGVDDAITLQNALSQVTKLGSYSIEAWVLCDGAVASDNNVFVNILSASDKNVLAVKVHSDGVRVRFGIYDGTSWAGKSTDSSIISSKYLHAVGVNSGGVLSLYSNGAVSSGTAAPSATASAGCYIGGGALYPFKGKIGMLRVYGKALNQQQVIELFRQNAQQFGLSA